MKDLKQVRDIRILKGMKEQGLIEFNEQTGTKITGLYTSRKFMCYYIDKAKQLFFNYNKKEYTTQFVSGCFCPYVFEVVESEDPLN